MYIYEMFWWVWYHNLLWFKYFLIYRSCLSTNENMLCIKMKGLFDYNISSVSFGRVVIYHGYFIYLKTFFLIINTTLDNESKISLINDSSHIYDGINTYDWIIRGNRKPFVQQQNSNRESFYQEQFLSIFGLKSR